MKDLSPGESFFPKNISDNPYDRILEARILSVSPETGKVDIEFVDFFEPRPAVRINFPYFSHEGAWIRIMPMPGDLVNIGVRPNGILEILNYKHVNYEQFTDEDSGDVRLFRKLNPGEIEILSIGGATAHFNKFGDLTISAVISEILLENERAKISYSSALHATDSGDSEYRFGEVRRKVNPVDPEESKITGVAGVLKEWFMNLVKDQTSKAFKFFKGVISEKVVDDLGIAVKHSKTLKDLRAKWQFFNQTGIDGLTAEIDVDGNLKLTIPATATEGYAVEVKGAGKVIMTCADIRLGGEAAIEKMILGNTFTTKLQAVVDAMVQTGAIQIGTGNLGLPVPLNSEITKTWTGMKISLDAGEHLSDRVKCLK